MPRRPAAAPDPDNKEDAMNRHRLLAVMLAAPLALLAAAPVTAAVPPDQVARETADMTLRQIRARKEELRRDPNQLYALVEQQILPHFDFERISQLVLGQHWRTASPEQRERFRTAFQRMLVRSYSHALIEYDSERIEWAPLRLSAGATDVVVRSNVIRKGGPPIPINYSVHLKNDRWLVYDVTIDAISLVTNYRGTFAGEIRKNGLDALIARLEQKQAGQSAIQ
jgi:phospholipid transport system substrate-binding protein